MTLSNRRGVLLTGFEPFGGEEVNPSSRIAASLHGTLVAGHPDLSPGFNPLLIEAPLRHYRIE